MERWNFTFDNVWKQDLQGVKQEVRELWHILDFRINTEEAEKRLEQIVFTVRNNDGQVIAVSTAFVTPIQMLHNDFYAVRLLIHPKFRIPGLTQKLMVMTRDYLEEAYKEDAPKSKGIITLVENEYLKKNLIDAVWRASSMIYIGKSPKGVPIRLYYFKDVEI